MAAHEDPNWRQLQSAPQVNAVGQLSFSPATQTTVVTTTTTTTTSFPPFVLNAPRDLRTRDPEVYPLAAIPTPTWLKKVTFSLGGQTALFEEAGDAQHRMYEVSGAVLSGKARSLLTAHSACSIKFSSGLFDPKMEL